MSVRFILRHTSYSVHTDIKHDDLFTVEEECPEIERQLKRGGRGDGGEESVSVVGAEVVEEHKR